MKKIALFLLTFCIAFSVSAQKVIKKNAFSTVAVEHTQPAIGNEISKNIGDQKPFDLPDSKDYIPVIIGSTVYDLQTNSTVTRRIDVRGDGTMSAVWTRGLESPSYPDRGTGFNYFDGSAWGTSPEARIEEDIRTGWPAIVGTDHDVAFSHDFAAGEIIKTDNTTFGADDWTSIVAISGSSMPGVNWPKAKAAGADGNTIHVVGGTNAELWEGIKGNIGYFRSTDGGVSWDITEFNVLGADHYAHVSGETWAIDAVGETVAILITTPWGDVAVYKSTDNGDSWTRFTILDFPDELEPFDFEAGMMDVDNDGVPDTLVSADQAGSVLIDNDGKVHAAFGLMRYDAPGDATWYYFPYSDGMTYWNEDMGEGVFSMDQVIDNTVYLNMQLGDDLDTLFMCPDLDGDDTIHEFAWENSVDGAYGNYGISLTSFPNLVELEGVGGIGLVYSTVMEGDDYAKMDANPGSQNYRHLWVATIDPASGGASQPVHITTGNDFALYEHAFPMCYRLAEFDGFETNTIKMIYQMDEEPGQSVNGDEDPTTSNYIMYAETDVFYWGVNDHSNKKSQNIFVFSPNPAQQNIVVTSEQNAEISIFNIVGAEVKHIENAQETETIDISNLSAGTYFIQVNSSKGLASEKLIVQ